MNLTPPPSFLQAPFNQSAHTSAHCTKQRKLNIFFFKAVLQCLFRCGKTRSAEKPFVSRVPSVLTARDSSNGASAEEGGGGGIPPHTHTTSLRRHLRVCVYTYFHLRIRACAAGPNVRLKKFRRYSGRKNIEISKFFSKTWNSLWETWSTKILNFGYFTHVLQHIIYESVPPSPMWVWVSVRPP